MAAASAKEQKTEVVEEIEKDAKRDSSPKIDQKAAFLTPDTTLNVLPSTAGNILVAMGEGALPNLVAAARANIGINAGRYMFEGKIVEKMGPKSQVRFGFSAAGSLFLGDDDNSICFDNDGFLVSNKKKSKCSLAFSSDVMVAVVLNRDASSANKDTISFFKDGVRASQPQALPAHLKGKTLFPAVSFKHATVHCNFESPVVPLPFKCKPVSEASQKDAVATKYEKPADGKYTALFPVSLPDEGTFDWLDSYLEKNPHYTELSDRAFADWVQKSGYSANKKKESNDKPNLGFGHGMDEFNSIKKALMEVVALQPRNFVVMEVKGNLITEERKKNLAAFKTSEFITVAEVVVGEPSSSFKRRTLAVVLQAKQDASDKEFRLKKVTEKRDWAIRKKTKDAAKIKKKLEKEAKKKAGEQKKKVEEAMKKRAEELKKKQAEILAKQKGIAAVEKEDEKKEEEVAKEAAVESEDEPGEADEPEPADEEPGECMPLDAEEKATRFAKHPVSDLAESVLNRTFAKFSLPDGEEGFDSVRYSWNREKEAAAYVQEWISGKKQTTRVEDIVPSAWFKAKNVAWTSFAQTCKTKQNDYKSMVAKKAAEKNARAAKKLSAERVAKAKAEHKAKAAEAKEAAAAKAKAEGKEVEKQEEEKEEKEEEKAPVEEAEEDPEPEIDFDGIDVFGAEDILNVGGKVPLFKEFQFEDFAMMSLRFQLNLLVNAFAKDCNDPDRTGVHMDHLAFYYQKYYGTPLTAQAFGVASLAELVAMADDVVHVTDKNIIESDIPADLESLAVFVKLTEDARRMRKMEVDMGVETAKLNIKGDNGHGQKRSWEESSGGIKSAWGANNMGKGGIKGGSQGGIQGGMQGVNPMLAKMLAGAGKGGWGGGFAPTWQKRQ